MKSGRQTRIPVALPARRSIGRRAFLLAVCLLTAIGTPVGHGVILGLHLVFEHSGDLAPGIQARFQATLEETRREWARELGSEVDSLSEHRHGTGEPHVHAGGATHAHAHPEREAGGAPLTSVVDGAERRDDAAHRVVTTSGEHAHDGYVHSHDDAETSRELALLTNGLSKHLLPLLPALPHSEILVTADRWPSAAASAAVYIPVPLPPPELV